MWTALLLVTLASSIGFAVTSLLLLQEQQIS